MSDTVIRIVVDSSQAERGATKAEKALDRIATASRRLDGALGGSQASISSIGRSSGTASAGIDKMSAAKKRSTSASKAASSALETEAQKTERLSKMVDASIEKLNRQRAAQQAAASAGAKARTTTPSDPGLFQAQNKMMGLTSAGKISADVLNGTKDLAKAADGVKKAEKAVEELGGKTRVSSGALREMIVLMREAGRGDFTRMTGSASILVQQLGYLEALMNPITLGFAAIAVGVGVVVTAMVKGQEEASRFNNMLALSGNYAGLTASSYEDMADRIAGATDTSIASNEGLITSLAKTNSFTKEQIEQLVTAADRLSKGTGQAAEDIITDFATMADGPTRYAQTISDTYTNIISPAQIAHIKLLEDTGQKQQALKAVIKDVTDGIARNTQDNTGIIVRSWNAATNSVSNFWTWLKRIGADNGTAGKLASVNRQIQAIYNSGGNHGEWSRLDALEKQRDALIKQQAAEEKAAEKQAAHTRMIKEGNAASRELATTYSGLVDSQTRFNNAVKRVKADVAAALKANPHDPVALNLQSHMGDVTQKLREQYLPKATAEQKKADHSAESAAKREARREAQRQANAEKFLKTLDAQATAAAQTPIEADITTKKQQLENILGRKLADNAEDRARLERITNDVISKRQGDLERELQKTNDRAQSDLDYRKKTLGMSDRQEAIEEAGRRAALKAVTDVGDKTTEQIQKEIERAKIIAGQTYDLEQQARLLGSMGQLSKTAAQQDQLRIIGEDRANLNALRDKGALSESYGPELAKKIYEEASKSLDDATRQVADLFKSDFAHSIEDLGDQFEGEFGRAISKIGQLLSAIIDSAHGDFSGLGPVGGLLDMLSQTNSPFLKAISQSAENTSRRYVDQVFGTNGEKSVFADPLKSLSDGFGDFKTDLHDLFGKNGDFAKGLGSTLGKAGIGAQVGDAADGLMKALGIKSSKTGAQIGGAIGGATLGPLGAVGGSILGGVFGGLFKKTKQASSSLSLSSFGTLSAMDATGHGSQEKEAAYGLASSVASGLNNIASQLGGILTGTGSVSVGYRPGHKAGAYRVDTSGQGKLTGVQAFENESDAIAYAIRDALKDGILTGVTDFTKRLLSAADDLDGAVALATRYESIVKELAAIDDPIGAPLAELNKEFKQLRDQMVANGAAAAELANVDRYYMIQRETLLKDQLSDIKSLQDKLNGEGSGLSDKSRLDKQLAEFRTYEADIAAGKSVDSAALSQLGSSIFDLAKDLYGTSTGAFQNIRSELLNTTDDLTKNIESIYADNGSADVVQAVDSQTQMIAQSVKEQQKSNALQERMVAALEAANDITQTLKSGSNGRQTGTL